MSQGKRLHAYKGHPLTDTQLPAAAYEDSDSGAMSFGRPSGTWISEIDKAIADWKPYNDRCDKIRDLYRSAASTKPNTPRKYALLWSNMETLKSSIYARLPVGVVQSRFKDGDPLVRVATTLLERAINFNLDISDYDQAFGLVRDDFLLFGRGVPRLVYRPVFEEVPDADDQLAADSNDAGEMSGAEEYAEAPSSDVASDDSVQGEYAEGETGEVLKFEHIDIVYVDRKDYITPQARRYEELPWVAYRAFLTRAELIEKFGEQIGQLVPLDASSVSKEQSSTFAQSAYDKATVYEIWDKCQGKVLWVNPAFPYILDECEPYLKLTGFFPSPRPAYGTLTTDSLEPVPEYVFYQDQAEEINALTARISSLIQSLKVVGFYAGGPSGEGFPEIEKAVKPGVENVMIAVRNWAAFGKGEGGAPIVWLPVEAVANIIKECVALRKQLIDDVYQITGISDIQRGATDPNETYGAQSLKAQFGSVRIRDRQEEMARLCRDTIRMMAEIISEHFHIETLMALANMRFPSQAEIDQATLQAELMQREWRLEAQRAQMTGQPIPPQPQPPQINGPTQEQIMMLLQDGIQRRFRIDIETDSTIAADQVRDQQQRTQFIQATTQFIQGWGPIIQANPTLAPLAGALLMFGVRAFPVGRELEEVVEETIIKIEQKAAQPPAPPQPSPDVVAKTQAEIAKANATVQTTKIKAQAEQTKAQLDMQQAIDNHARASQQHEMDMQSAGMQHMLQMAKLEEQRIKAFQPQPVAYPNLMTPPIQPTQPQAAPMAPPRQ